MMVSTRVVLLLLLIIAGCVPARSARRVDALSASSRVAAAIADGETHYWAGQLDSAEAGFSNALSRAESDGDSLGRARATTWLGLVAWRSARFDEAIAHGRAALALALRLDNSAEVYRANNLLGLVAWEQGRLEDADSLFQQAASAARLAGDAGNIARVHGNRGLVRLDRGDYVGARENLEEMLKASQRLGEQLLEANALSDLASIDLVEGDLVTARARLTVARARYASLAYPLGEATVLTRLSSVHVEAGEYPLALAAADSAATIATTHGYPRQAADALAVMADALTDLGNHAQALRALDSVKRIQESLDLPIEQGTTLRRTAKVLDQLGRNDAAITAAGQALAIHEGVGASTQRLADLLLLSTIDAKHASSLLDRARALADSLGDATARADVLLAVSRWHLDRGEYGRAAAVLDRLPRVRAGDPSLEWQIADLRAVAERGLGRLPQAEAQASAAVASLERMRVRPPEAATATGDRLVEIRLERGDIDGAFEAASVGVADPRVAVTEGEHLLRRIRDLARLLESARDKGDTVLAVELEHRLVGSRDSYERLLTPDARGAGNARPAAIRASLGGDEALLTWFLGFEDVHLFVSTQHGTTHRALAISRQELEGRVRLGRDLVSRVALGQAFLPVMQDLYATLLEPARAALGGEWPARLILVAPGFLAHLPFGALRDTSEGKYLVEQTELVRTTSASAVTSLRDQSARLTLDNGLSAFAPDPQDLPWSVNEARQVAAIVPGGIAVIGRKATERRLRKVASQVDVLHVAAHATLNSDNPAFSLIQLRGAGSAPADDGVLEAHEVSSLPLRARLVFLSGCETGLGDRPGDVRGPTDADVTTLASVFLRAGSEVVATLWRIPDQATGTLVEGFYRRVLEDPPARALARAQRELLRRADTAHPYYWAAFVLLGGSS